MQNNPTLVQAAHRVEALRGKYLQAGLYPNPVIGYVGEEMGDEGGAGQQGGFVAQQFITAGKRRLDRAIVAQEIAQVEQDWEIQNRRVINDVRASAYGVLVAQRTVRLSEQLVQIGDEGRQTAERLLEAKEVGRPDVLQARIEANAAKLQLTSARNQYTAAWRKLASILGVPDMAEMPLEDSLEGGIPEFTWEQSVDRLLGNSPVLVRAYTNAERARYVLSRAYATRVPNVDVETAVQYNNASEDTTASVRLGVPLPLFNRNQGNIFRAQSELAVALEEVRRVELTLQDRLADAFKLYTDAKAQVRRYEGEILPDAKDALELVRKGYRQGEFSYLQLLTAQRTFFQVNLAYVHALRDLWTSANRIEGMLLSGGLNAVGGP